MHSNVPSMMAPGTCINCERQDLVWLSTNVCARLDCHEAHIAELAMTAIKKSA